MDDKAILNELRDITKNKDSWKANIDDVAESIDTLGGRVIEPPIEQVRTFRGVLGVSKIRVHTAAGKASVNLHLILCLFHGKFIGNPLFSNFFASFTKADA